MWRCIIPVGMARCGEMISQNILTGKALCFEVHKEFRYRRLFGIYSQIKYLDSKLATNLKGTFKIPSKMIGGVQKIDPKVSIESTLGVQEKLSPKSGDRSLWVAGMDLITTAIDIVEQSTTLDEAKMSNSTLE